MHATIRTFTHLATIVLLVHATGSAQSTTGQTTTGQPNTGHGTTEAHREIPLAHAATQSPTAGATALFSSRDGLLVRGWPGAPHGDLVLPGGAEPRFDPASGALYFVRSVEVDDDEVSRSTWVLDPSSAVPHRVTAAATIPAWAPPQPLLDDGPGVKITIDPGHGGNDPGALGNGLREADINLDVALRLQALLQADTADPSGGGAWDVLMTRTTDSTLSLAGRTNAANAFGAASFLSIHMNAFSSSTANGSETFCHTTTVNGTSGAMRNRIHPELIAAWNRTDRGVKTANFYVLRNTNMPAVLVEGAFITNPGDAAVMGNAQNRETLALHLLFALQEHHGFARYEPGTGGPTNTGRLRTVVYDASLGPTARIAGATVSLADGTFARTDLSGYAEFDLPGGAYEFAATAARFGFAATGRNVVVGSDVWGSLALPPVPAPTVTASATSVPTNAPFNVVLAGADPLAPATLLLNFSPGVPLVDLSFLGLGTLWPNLNNLIAVNLGTTSVLGTALMTFNTPNGGFSVHLQGATLSGGSLVLTNGTAFEVL